MPIIRIAYSGCDDYPQYKEFINPGTYITVVDLAGCDYSRERFGAPC